MVERAAREQWAEAGRALAVFAATFALAWLCLLVPRATGNVTPIWLPNAALLAILLLSPRRQWRAFTSAGFLGLVLANLVAGSPALVSTALALCNTAEVLVCAALLLKTLGRRPDLSQPRSIGRFALIVGAAAMASGALAALFLRSLSDKPGLETFAVWAIADFAGLVTVTPCLVLLAINWRRAPKLSPLSGWPLAVLLLAAAAVFAQDRYPLNYIMVAALLLVTWRMGMVGAAVGVLLTFGIAIGATLAGRGPFGLMDASLVERVLALQLFLAACFYLSVPVAIQSARARALRDRLVRALASARAAGAKYRRIADGARDIIVQSNRDAIIYVSPSCRQYGYAPADLIGMPVLALLHPDDAARFEALRASFFDKPGEIARSEWRVRVRTRAGDYRWVEGAPNLLRDRKGQPAAIETIFSDVTDRLATEEALAASEARYRMLAENLTDMAVSYAQDGVVRFVSPAAKALLGYDPDELVGRQIATLLHPDDVARCGAEFARRRRGGPDDAGPFRIEYRLFRRDGSVVWVEAHPRPIFDPQTRAFVEWQDVVRDIGDRKALEAELRTARAEAEAAAQAKSDFLANMSHELRTPLTSVIGFSQLARASAKLEGPVRTYVERVSESSRGLLALINDILDFSKLEAGEVTFRLRPVDVAELVGESLRLFEAQSEEKGLTLRLEDNLPSGLRLELDPDRLRQVLVNLIGNAVKFTQSGGVWVTPRYDRDAGTLSVEVRDTGPGITTEGQERLFQRFSQVDGSQGRHGGTGLGLAICKGIVEAMGGHIGVTSKEGHGSTFAFVVPATPAQAAGTDGAGGRERIRLLLADDQADIRELVGLLLEDIVELSAVPDGEAAVRLAAERAFDVMLFDQRMPRLHGSEALRWIRASPGPNRNTPALAFSAEADVGSSRHFAEMGFDGTVAKPVSRPELVSAIATAVHTAPTPTAPDGPAEASAGTGPLSRPSISEV